MLHRAFLASRCSARTSTTRLVLSRPPLALCSHFTSASTTLADVHVAEPLILSSKSKEGIVTLTFNAPSKMNCMTVEMGEQFEAAVTDLVKRDLALPPDQQMKVVILTGKGKAFSAGGELDFIFQRANSTALANR